MCPRYVIDITGTVHSLWGVGRGLIKIIKNDIFLFTDI